MHELGIIIHLNKTLHEIAEENQLHEIGTVVLEVGEVSAIIPHYLSDCWEYYRKKFPLIEQANLVIDVMPASSYCEDCQKSYPTVQYGKTCPYCHNGNTYLLTGNECNIREIEAQ